MGSILVIDDESSVCWAIQELGAAMGHDVDVASTAERGLEILTQLKPDVIFLDVRLPGISGLEASPEIKRVASPTPVVLITAFGELEVAVEAVKQGTFEYLVKPFSLQQVQTVVERALAFAPRPAKPKPAPTNSSPLVGVSSAMQNVFKRIALAANSQAPIIIQGESGTGKELVAQAIHSYGPRQDQPFVAVNIASLSPSLIESELFGHVKGAFTDAQREKQGYLQLASGGTLFLDEIAEVPLPTQAKLLRVLEQQELTPVGSASRQRVDFRVVCATHRNLNQCVREGTFRHDLLFRLNTFRIELPPLRERREDIAPLVTHFLLTLQSNYDQEISISPAAITELENRPWYGNVRELRNAVEHANILAQTSVIEPWHLPSPAAQSWFDPADPSTDPVQELATAVGDWTRYQLESDHTGDGLWGRFQGLAEKEMLHELWQRFDGQYLAIGKSMGIHRTTVKKKCQQYGIAPLDSED